MAIGHAVSDATKKKISDALKGRGKGKKAPSVVKALVKGPAINTKSKVTKAEKVAIYKPPAMKSVKAPKAAKPPVAKVSAKTPKVSVDVNAKAAVKAAQQSVKQATHDISVSQGNVKKAAILETKVQALLGKASSPEQKAQLQASLDRIATATNAHLDNIKKSQTAIDTANAVIKSGGAVTQQALTEYGHYFALHEKKFTVWRTLSLQEQRVDFQALNQTYDDYEASLEDELTTASQEDIDRAMASAKARLKTGDIAAITALIFVSYNKIYQIVNKWAKKSYDAGKQSAAKEIKVPQPVTPTVKTQIVNMNSDMIAEQYTTTVDLAAKQKAVQGFSKGVDESAIVSAIAIAAQTSASKMIASLSGNVIGENINKGRRTVFESQAASIKAYQRTEILDGRTCNMCLELDETILPADDPMAQLDEVHDNCRGLWVPIMTDETINEDDVGLDPDVRDAFQTIGGAPITNSFTQLKKPTNDLSRPAAAEVQRRMQSKSALDKKFGSN